MKIYLVRHGEKESEGADAELTENGERQITLLARRLKHDKVNVSRIYSTNHSRSVRTAEILSKALALPVVRDDRLRELERNLFNEQNSNVEHDDVQAVNLFIEEMVSRRQDIILAMHGGINRAVISYLTGIGLYDMRHFFMDFASVSLIELVEIDGQIKWRVKMLNDTTHLRVP